MSTTTVAVEGMSCQHCVNAVIEHVSAIAGVETVEVDLDHGHVTVTSAGALEPGDLDRAITDAGYALRS